MAHSDKINQISLYESRLSRIVARNTELLIKRQANRPQRATVTEAAPAPPPVAEVRVQTAGAAASATAEPPTEPNPPHSNQPLTFENGFASRFFEIPAAPVLHTAIEVPESTEKAA
jgi:hypothetical protein